MIRSFSDLEKTYEPHVVYPQQRATSYPAVMVFHAWAGRDEFACQKAEQLAQLGYVAIAVDLYGHARVGKDRDENQSLMMPFMQNRAKLRRLVMKNLEFVAALPHVDPQRIAAIGFCFGGLCALDLARSGAPIAGVVSFHGLLNPLPQDLGSPVIQAQILALHGHDDPMVTPDDVLTFEEEMSHAQADWQVHIYGHTLHAFTQPQAQDPQFGTVYQPRADRRSWIAMKNFLEEVFHR